MSEAGRRGAIVLDRTDLMMDTDGRGQAQTERGRLVVLDQDGCVVLEVNGTHVRDPQGAHRWAGGG